ncbi:hypothetical protein D9M68_975480 [compost metagenome]
MRLNTVAVCQLGQQSPGAQLALDLREIGLGDSAGQLASFPRVADQLGDPGVGQATGGAGRRRYPWLAIRRPSQ